VASAPGSRLAEGVTNRNARLVLAPPQVGAPGRLEELAQVAHRLARRRPQPAGGRDHPPVGPPQALDLAVACLVRRVVLVLVEGCLAVDSEPLAAGPMKKMKISMKRRAPLGFLGHAQAVVCLEHAQAVEDCPVRLQALALVRQEPDPVVCRVLALVRQFAARRKRKRTSALLRGQEARCPARAPLARCPVDAPEPRPLQVADCLGRGPVADCLALPGGHALALGQRVRQDDRVGSRQHRPPVLVACPAVCQPDLLVERRHPVQGHPHLHLHQGREPGPLQQ